MEKQSFFVFCDLLEVTNIHNQLSQGMHSYNCVEIGKTRKVRYVLNNSGLQTHFSRYSRRVVYVCFQDSVLCISRTVGFMSNPKTLILVCTSCVFR